MKAAVRLTVVVVVTTLVLLQRPPSAEAQCLVPPVRAPVSDPFRAPPCPYCPGNRGIEYATAPGTRVAAAAGGVVTFSGLVATRRFVVVRHTDGQLATYGLLATATVTAGRWVRAGQLIGTTAGRFYFGLRRGAEYIDPTPYLGTLRYRPRLVPADGRPGRAPPPPVLRCPVGE